MSQLIIVTLTVTAVAALLATLTFHGCAHLVLGRRHRRHAVNRESLPAVSILKPLKGLDDELYENLAAIARLDYPRFEIIFGAADEKDPALEVARRVQREHPHVAIRVVHGEASHGANPKVVNLENLVRHARHEWLLISDSNVRPSADYLCAMARELIVPKTGLVHSTLTGVGEKSFGALLENLHLNTFVAAAVAGPGVLAGLPCVVGKSMLLSRQALAAAGGFEAVRDVLAEDYILGARIRAAGHRVAQSAHVLPTISVRRSVRDFWNRHVRWGQMRRRIAPSAYIAETLLNPLPLLALAAASALSAGESELGQMALGGAIVKLGADLALVRRLRASPLRLSHLVALPMKDLIAFAVWWVAAFKRTVRWRGHARSIGPGSLLAPVTPMRMRYDFEPELFASESTVREVA